MADIFSTNQVNHAYVVNSFITDGSALTNAGDMSMGTEYSTGTMYFKHMGAGGLTRSDLIENIMHIKATPAGDMSRTTNVAKIGINTAALNNGAPIVGQDYLMRVEFMNPIGMSWDNKYWKQGIAHAVTGETVKSLLLKLAKSFARSMAREAQPIVKIYVAVDGDNKVEVKRDSDITNTTTYPGNYNTILIREVVQPWILGTKQQKPIMFTVNNSTVKDADDNEIFWMDVTYANGYKVTGGMESSISYVTSGAPTGDVIINSKRAADLEYFSMGDRADLYRNVGWPNVIKTEYLVDPNNATGYDMVSIHYAYTGSNHAVQKSEKDITFICKRSSSETDMDTLGAVATALKGAIDAVVNPVYVQTSGTVTTGHLAEFDAEGNIVDSGKSTDSFEPAV